MACAEMGQLKRSPHNDGQSINSLARICVAAGNGHRVSEIETGMDLTITPNAEIRHRQRERAPLVAYFLSARLISSNREAEPSCVICFVGGESQIRKPLLD